MTARQRHRHPVIVHDIAAADIQRVGIDDMKAHALVEGDAGCVVAIDPQRQPPRTAGTGCGYQVLQQLPAQALAARFGG
tara:strand:+ start:2762 stop:2998 length:237 start_codon:yes stop_codon:yes gene_type:complete